MSFLGNLMAEHDPPQRTWDSSPHALYQDNERLLRAKSSKHSYRNAAAEPTYAARGHGMHGFNAANDDAAFKHARQFVNGYDVELWSGGRFVAKLEPTK